MLTKADILHQLEAFREAQGHIVSVHTSLKAIGEIDGGGEMLLSALISFFANDGGMLCIPTHTWDTEVYDRRRADSCTGVLSMLAAAHPAAVRTTHPSHSMAVFGRQAELFSRADDTTNTPVHPRGCYGKLYEEDGFILLIGVGQEKNTFIHCVEEMLHVPGRLTKDMVERTVIHKDGRKEKRCLHWFDEETIPDVSDFFGKFEQAFRHHGAIVDGYIGRAKVQLCRARKLKEVIELIYERNDYGELLNNDDPLDEALYL